MPKSEIQKRPNPTAETFALRHQSIRNAIRLNWNPGRLEIPRVSEDFQALDPIARGGEVIRYSILRTEYWISPNGIMREWVRWNLAVGLALAIPSVVIVPVVTLLMGVFVTWSGLIIQIAKNLLLFPLLAIVIIGLGSAIIILIRAILPQRK
jgi:hypothetical protein